MKALQAPMILTLITLICTFWFPWYFIPIACFVLGYMYSIKPLNAFITGLFITTLTWVVLALIYDKSSVISIAHLLSKLLEGISIAMVYVLTGISIGLVSGLSMLSGSFLNISRKHNR